MVFKSVDFTAKVAGDGLWSETKTTVRVIGLEISVYQNDEISGGKRWGSLNAYFDTKTWDIDKIGLIYTDSKFTPSLTKELIKLGFDKSAVSPDKLWYSEQGMQGIDFVNFDIEIEFIEGWEQLYGKVEAE